MSFAAPDMEAGRAASGLASVRGLSVPSGQELELYEVLIDEVGPETWVRFRFLAPMIGQGADEKSFADVEGDFEHICTALALPYLDEYALTADAVVVTMLSRPVEFGVSDPEVTQYVEVFRVSAGLCIWEGL
jgi:hypothetical protein